MTADAVIELIKLAPTILWMLFLGGVLFAYRKRIDRLWRRMSGFKAFGVEVTFLEEKLDRATEKQAVAISRKGARDLATAKREIAISDKDRAQLLRRINYVADLMDGAGVLWVDDNPENNAYEMKLLRSLGIRIDVAESTSQALQFLGETKYDAVISDMARDGTPDAGLRFLTEIQDRGMTQRPIFYVGEHLASKGTPAGAFAITNRPDHLIHYLIDVLERERSD